MFLSKESFSDEEWNDPKFQLRNLIKTSEGLEKWVALTDGERKAIEAVKGKYLWQSTPYYASLMDKHDENCPIRLQTIPHLREMNVAENSDNDPVGDTANLKTARVVHKYPNRIVLLVSDTCPVYCRHCTRKFHTTDVSGTYFGSDLVASYEEDFAYIENHPEIDDVLLTGGDPLIHYDKFLETIIKRLRSISHINIIRIGTRYPVFAPQRVTEKFCQMLEKYHPIWVNTHFNHPKEVTEEAAAACDRLLRHGIPVQNQSVLLKGINDDVATMRSLLKALLRIRVRPYYLYHCDNVSGVSHFMTTLEKGQEIMDAMVGFETGFSVPQYVVTTTLGKLSVNRAHVTTHEDGRVTAKNYKQDSLDITEYIKPPSDLNNYSAEHRNSEIILSKTIDL
ncbi:arginine 2,3-aminomutase [Xenorhabdus bovienii]|uniref:Arginine aminomutase n=3 Tax=Xenorhabdus bovienii TaxID=40576 RepID=A0A077N3Q9_XENBV|nr:arginine 2,3-aminomutase [Xenorhabdus bovienii]MCG3471772.1 arginine 2,3-aminomutase [Xenorhabdus bovienii]CDG90458.1 Arginine aminomutase [Xenorhabdus bovienii str. feltiae France]CDG91726.1 Arginine aminomutase [Xenorhabdus bovienii str. feltiae Florida]CDG96841.1 Arginine aminomutase [Xenorhabdus bovienii str. puntauvense]CDH01151.1 Arginine aminomutase [Xenorhabdus bovienii str. feltiae Moldova]